MIVENRTDSTGQTYTVMIPETEADLAEVLRLDRAGKIDARSSFGDNFEVIWEGGRRACYRRSRRVRARRRRRRRGLR
jgi:hypothetical protein